MGAMDGQGTVIEVKDSGGAYIAIGGIKSVGGPTIQRTVLDDTTLSSTAKSKRLGLKDSGQYRLSGFRDPANTGQTRLKALLDAGTAGEFRITYTDTGALQETFSAYVSSKGSGFEVDALVTLEVNLEVTGSITEA